LGKIGGVFITKCCPECLSGLPGLILTAYDAGKTSLNIIGPPGLTRYLENIDRFIRRPDIKVNIQEAATNSAIVYTTSDISVECISIDSSSVIYICKTPEKPGKFNIAKAHELKIPKGPLYGALKSGLSITLPNGETIHPDQVLGEADNGRSFAIIGRLDENELESLLKHEVFRR
jgi:ribonuclease Z